MNEYLNLLNELYEKTISHISQREWKYLHLRTIGNFITHFDKIPEDDKPEVFSRIIEYLQRVKEVGKLDVKHKEDRKIIRELYEQMVYPLAYEYYNAIGFFPYASRLVNYTILITVLTIIFLLQIPDIFYYLVLVIFIGVEVYTLKKRNDNKVYGYKY